MECRCTKVMREKALEPGEPPVYHGPGMAPAGKSTMDDIHHQASGASARRPPSRPTRAAALPARAARPDPRRARARPAGPIARAEERGVARSPRAARARGRPTAVAASDSPLLVRARRFRHAAARARAGRAVEPRRGDEGRLDAHAHERDRARLLANGAAERSLPHAPRRPRRALAQDVDGRPHRHDAQRPRRAVRPVHAERAERRARRRVDSGPPRASTTGARRARRGRARACTRATPTRRRRRAASCAPRVRALLGARRAPRCRSRRRVASAPAARGGGAAAGPPRPTATERERAADGGAARPAGRSRATRCGAGGYDKNAATLEHAADASAMRKAQIFAKSEGWKNRGRA